MIEIINQLPPISLADLQDNAEFLTRRDRKYLVPEDAFARLLAAIDPETRALDIDGRRSFGYLSPYFDNDGYAAYLSAARRRPNRFKVRTRLYVDSGLCMLEVKTRDPHGRTVKHRIEHSAEAICRLVDDERDWLADFPQVCPVVGGLQHCMSTTYQRSTLMLPGGAGRVTIDSDLRFSLPNGASRRLQRFLVIETKGAGGPTSFDRLLWRHGFRPVSMSKFTTGLSLLLPELPANRWHRLRNRLDQATTSEQYTVLPGILVSLGDRVPSNDG